MSKPKSLIVLKPSKSILATCLRLVALKIQEEATAAEQEILKGKMSKYSGKTFPVTGGSVQVTVATEGGGTGEFVATIDQDKFWALSQRNQAKLVKAGIITIAEKVTKAQGVQVKVTLEKQKNVAHVNKNQQKKAA